VEMLSNKKKKNLGVHMERTKPMEETKSHFQGSSLLFPTLFRSTSMYPILFSFSCWKNENLPPIKH
jgi:hypothetical protein